MLLASRVSGFFCCVLLTFGAVTAGCGSSGLNVDVPSIDAGTDARDASVVDSSPPPREAAAPDAAPDAHGNCGDVKIVCDGLCVDPVEDLNNCGGCDRVCPIACVAGQ